MPLPSRQIDVLRYLGEHKTATAGNIRRDLGLSRHYARNALQGLADKGFVSKGSVTIPPSWVITEIGAAVLAAAGQDPK